MASRRALATCAIFFVASVDGCSLARAVITPNGGIDAAFGDASGGVHDTGMPHDGGVACTPGGCDDGNPCTDDVCNPSSGCTRTPNRATCNDGVLCNGGDTCAAGTCSVHDGVNPCSGGTTCDPAANTCTGCVHDADCPTPINGAYGACDFGASVCATAGTQMRDVQTFHCNAGSCMPTTTMQSQACTRVTESTVCAAPTVGAWSACNYASACAESAMQTRTVTTSTCHAGSCMSATSPESQACTRTTTSMSCGGVTMSAWSPCMASGCSTSGGMQTRTVTTPTCMGGACAMTMTTETSTCTVSSTDGQACGMPACTAWSACTQATPMSCSTSGQQTRSCMTPTCSGGACGSGMASLQTQACAVAVDGQACSETSCGGCHEMGSFACMRGNAGVRNCRTQTGTCMTLLGSAPFCAGNFPTNATQPCTCP